MTGRPEWDGKPVPDATATVVNLRHAPEAGDDLVRIDRKTGWGNPYRKGPHGSRLAVIELYRAHLRRFLRSGEIGLEDLAALDGKRLACWCAPQPCHGDVLKDAAAWAVQELRRRKGAV